MRGLLALTVALAGCNAIFGLAPTSLGGDGGATDDADHRGPDAETADAVPPSHHGDISATSYGYMQDGSVVNQYGAAANIGHLSPACDITPVSSACSVYHCATVPDPGPWPDTGTIEIIGTNSVALTPDTNGAYAQQSNGTMRLFLDGNPVEIGSTGGEVPAIDEVFAAPHSVSFTAGAVADSSTSPAFARDQDLAYAWNGGATTEIVEIVIQDALGVDVVCRFPDGAGAGTGTIPAEALVQLAAGPGSFVSLVYTTETVLAGAYDLDLYLQVVSKSPSGDFASGAVTLQ
jgi:hypothetical protein